MENNFVAELDEINISKLILTATRALLGEIRPNMRRIYVDYLKKENKILLYFFYDTPPTQEEIDDDIEGDILTEMCVFFNKDVAWNSKSCTAPYPQVIVEPPGLLVYARYEPILKGEQMDFLKASGERKNTNIKAFPSNKSLLLKDDNDIDNLSEMAGDKFMREETTEEELNVISNAKLILAANRGIIGEIRPNMRNIYVGYHKEENKIVLYFFYDTQPIQDDVERTIITEMRAFFTEYVAWDSISFVVPYPQRIIEPPCLCVYGRYEPTPEGEE